MKFTNLLLLTTLTLFISCTSAKNATLDSKYVLYVIDGVPVQKVQLDNLSEDDLVEVYVLKGEAARALYGKAAKNGCVLVTTKKSAREIYQKKFSGISPEYKNLIQHVSSENDLLYVINGKPVVEYVESTLFKIEPKDIIKIIILEPDDANSRYGILRKEGAVLINTK